MTGWLGEPPPGWQRIAEAALLEDNGPGDLSAAMWPEGANVRFRVEAQADGVLCGAALAAWLLDAKALLSDGAEVSMGSLVLEGSGPTAAALARERVALNFLMHLSGVASLTREFVTAATGTRAVILDTRKTLPNLRSLQKYAVRCGGGQNHRMGLYGGIMLKDNHIRAAGGVRQAIEAMAKRAGASHRIEVECDALDQVDEAVAAGAEIVLLDNMPCEQMREAVSRHSGRCLFEASGGVSLDTVAQIAATGVDFISVGALTHSAPSLPFHLEVL